MHKIFKLCGSPSEGYWQRKKLPYATSFKPQNAYKRQLADTFKDFPSTALALVDRLLSMEPEQRGSATSALHSEVILSQHPFFHYIGLFQIDSVLFVIIVINIILTLLMFMLDIVSFSLQILCLVILHVYQSFHQARSSISSVKIKKPQGILNS
jgi:serine/threonine protein kinase